MLPLHRSSEVLSFEAVLNLEPLALSLDWFGKKSERPLLFRLAIDPERLFFVAERFSQPDCDMNVNTGEFLPELWKRDVAELFIKDDNSASYQEINLSPAGAWWSALFREYREQDSENFQHPASLSCFSQVGTNQWRSGLSMLLEELSVNCNFDSSSRANACAGLGSDPQRLYSFLKLEGEEPDFHRF